MSPLARAILLALAKVMRLDTFPLECGFAFLKRITKLYGATHTQALIHHAACFVLAKQRLLECSPGTKPAFSEINLPTAEPQVQKVNKPGGSWRAWISRWLNTKVGTERFNFKQAAIEYGQLSMRGGPEWDKLVQEGRQATEASRAGGPAFAKGRSIVATHRPSFSDPVQQVLEMDFTEVTHAELAPAPPPSEDAEHQVEALAVQTLEDTPADLESYNLLQLARFEASAVEFAHQKAVAERSLALREAGRKLRQDRLEMTNQLEKWAEKARHEEWAQPFCEKKCIPRPSMYEDISHAEIVMPVTEMAKHVLDRCGGGQIAGLARGLFEQNTAFILSKSCHLQIPRNTKSTKTTCQEWGFCICGDRGKLVQYRLQSWKHAMEKPLQKDASMRKSYDEGLALLELTCESGEVAYVSLAFLNLTTKLGSLLHLVKDPSASRQRLAEVVGGVSLEVRGHGEEAFKTVHRTLWDFDLTKDWYAQELRAVTSASPIHPFDFTPRIVVCKRTSWRIHLFGSTGPLRKVGLLVQRPAKRRYPGEALAALADTQGSRRRLSGKQRRGTSRTHHNQSNQHKTCNHTMEHENL